MTDYGRPQMAAPETPAEIALAALDDSAQLVEFLTGVKAQYVAAGWTGAAAEQITIEVFKAGQARR